MFWSSSKTLDVKWTSALMNLQNLLELDEIEIGGVDCRIVE